MIGSDDHTVHCESLGVRIEDSGLENAGRGLFLVSPKRAGDPWDFNATDVLRLPYAGKYNHAVSGDRSIVVQQTRARDGSRPVFLLGNPNCPATFINDPMVC